MQQSTTERTVFTAFVAVLVVIAGVPGVVAGASTAASQGADQQVSVQRMAAQQAAPQPLDACGTIDEPGEYVLQGNVTDAPAENDTDAPAEGCFEVTADDVTTDGDGHVVAGNGSGVAISAAGVDEPTVENVTLTNWSVGVAIDDAPDASVVDVTVTDVTDAGVSIAGASRNAELRNSTVRNATAANETVGVRVSDGVGGVAVVGTQFEDLSGVAVALQADSGSVTDNQVRSTGGGISVTDPVAVTVQENTLRDVRGTSIRVAGDGESWWERLLAVEPLYAQFIGMPAAPETTRIVDNTVHDGNGNGIVVDNASSIEVVDNLVERSRDGIRVSGGSGVTVTNNTALENRDDGIKLAMAPAAVVDNNSVRDNADDGIYVVTSDTTLTANLATGNGDDGVDVQNSTGVAVRGNSLVENDNDGLFFRGVVDGLVEVNDVRDNGDDGVDLRGTDSVTVVNNTVCGNQDNDVIPRTGANATATENNSC